VVARDAPDPGIDEPPVCTVVIMFVARAAAISAHIRTRSRKAPKPALASQTPCFAISPRSLPVSPGSRMTEPAWTVMPPAGSARSTARRDRERLEPSDRADVPHVHLGGADGRGDAAMDVAFQITDVCWRGV